MTRCSPGPQHRPVAHHARQPPVHPRHELVIGHRLDGGEQRRPLPRLARPHLPGDLRASRLAQPGERVQVRPVPEEERETDYYALKIQICIIDLPLIRGLWRVLYE
jgi:hypothetical protein